MDSIIKSVQKDTEESVIMLIFRVLASFAAIILSLILFDMGFF